MTGLQAQNLFIEKILPMARKTPVSLPETGMNTEKSTRNAHFPYEPERISKRTLRCLSNRNLSWQFLLGWKAQVDIYRPPETSLV